MTTLPPSTAAPAHSRPALAYQPSMIDSQTLLAGSRELIIQHGSERYRLLLTAQNKLILTK